MSHMSRADAFIMLVDRERSIDSPESLLPKRPAFPGGSFHLSDALEVARRRSSGSEPRRSGADDRRSAGARAAPPQRALLWRRATQLASIGDGGEHALGDTLAGEADLLVQERGLAVRDVAVGESDAHDPRAGSQAGVVERLPSRRAEAARQHALLNGHQQVVLGR